MKSKRILIVNQHGENRGDEAAMRAMIRGLARELGQETEFDVVVQFEDKTLEIPFEQKVRLHPIFPSVLKALGLFIFGSGRFIGLPLHFLLGHETRNIVIAFENADMIISAPGGPYFGDIYAGHEPVHWFYVWLGSLYKKPMFLYSSSCGPFEKKTHNWFRRKIFKLFDTLCIREARSVDYLKKFLGPDAEVNLTADSAIQEDIVPFQRNEFFTKDRARLADKFLVAVTGMQYKYPGDPDPPRQRAHFTQVFLTLMQHLNNKRDCHFIFLPQLCGNVHDDRSYHKILGDRLPFGSSWEMVPEDFNSDRHRQIFGMADFCIASRYHPQIFATSNAVPGVFPCYEHKQFAYLEAMGISGYAFDINSLDAQQMCGKIDEALAEYDSICERLKNNITGLQERSRNTSRLAAGLFEKFRKQTH